MHDDVLGMFLLAARFDKVPAVMLGTWAHGSCAVRANRLMITPTTAALGNMVSAEIVYDADRGGGRAAIRWRQAYNVDNFVYVSAAKKIVHNTQGFGMPGAVVYTRCRLPQKQGHAGPSPP